MILLIAGCADEEEPARAPEREQRPIAAPPQSPPAAASRDPPRKSATEADGASEVLRRYYDHIESRRYNEAFALREARSGDDFQAFAAHFARFESHQATVGKPSQPVAAGEWLYVELPVQTYGTRRDGTPFGSAGTITLRRAKQGGPWRIYTKG